MACLPPKDVELASSIPELADMADIKGFDFIKTDMNKIVIAAERALLEARKHKMFGDLERTFIFYLKFVEIVKGLKKNKEYSRAGKIVDHLRNQAIKCLNDAEDIKKILVQQYEEKKKKEELEKKKEEEEREQLQQEERRRKEEAERQTQLQSEQSQLEQLKKLQYQPFKLQSLEQQRHLYSMQQKQLLSAYETPSFDTSDAVSSIKIQDEQTNTLPMQEQMQVPVMEDQFYQVQKQQEMVPPLSDPFVSGFQNATKPAPTAPPASMMVEEVPPTKPSDKEQDLLSISKPSPSTSKAQLVDGLVRITLEVKSFEKFMAKAVNNTRRDIETCGVLAGKLMNDRSFYVTHIIIPKQRGSSDTCEMLSEEEVLMYQDENDLLTLGWIHTHPSHDCFLSSVDMHTHCGYQTLLKEAVAVVMAPRCQPNYGIFSLTDPYGLSYIQRCKERGFHPHPKGLYTNSRHIQVEHQKSTCIIKDLR